MTQISVNWVPKVLHLSLATTAWAIYRLFLLVSSFRTKTKWFNRVSRCQDSNHRPPVLEANAVHTASQQLLNERFQSKSHTTYKNGPFPASFSLFSSFQYTVDSIIQMFDINKFLLITGFETRTSGIGSNRSTSWATTTSPSHMQLNYNEYIFLRFIEYVPSESDLFIL